MTTRKFYKTTITIEVLSEEPIPEEMDLADIIQESSEGAFSRGVVSEKETVLNGEQAVKALAEQGSDPEFFGLDEKGNDLE
jgi:hypothetical protein